MNDEIAYSVLKKFNPDVFKPSTYVFIEDTDYKS